MKNEIRAVSVRKQFTVEIAKSAFLTDSALVLFTTNIVVLNSMDQTEAIVLRTVEYSESSYILSLYSRNFGKLEAIAKGGRRLKSSYESSLDILSCVQVGVIRKRNDVLDILTESKLVRRFRVEPLTYPGMFAGYTAVELVNSLTETENPNPQLYDLLKYAIWDFGRGSFTTRSLIRFEWLLLDHLGLRPSFEFCVECGEDIQPDSKNKIAFGHLDGGVLCSKCRIGHSQVALVRSETINAIHRLTESTHSISADYELQNWTRFSIEKPVLGEIRGLTSNYMVHVLGKKTRLLEYLPVIVRYDRDCYT